MFDKLEWMRRMAKLPSQGREILLEIPGTKKRGSRKASTHIVTSAIKTRVSDRRSSTREGKDSNRLGAIRLGAVLPFPVAGGTSALEIVAGSHSELLASVAREIRIIVLVS
jgi:hypothetical protein